MEFFLRDPVASDWDESAPRARHAGFGDATLVFCPGLIGSMLLKTGGFDEAYEEYRVGIFLPFAPLWAVPVFALQFLCQLQRMRYEEGVLTHSFPEYAAYAARTPRLIPHLF
jgi:hypothetical protein